VLAGIKHLNRLEQVLARSEWDDPEIAEGLMLDTEGRVVEGTMSNLFLVRDRTLLTPDLSCCGVAGIMRGLVLDLARELGIRVVECALVPADLEVVDALFVTNSLIGLCPVQELDGRSYAVDAIPETLRRAVDDHAWE
jgi:4-amino-4-deoxychorismate lyase